MHGQPVQYEAGSRIERTKKARHAGFFFFRIAPDTEYFPSPI